MNRAKISACLICKNEEKSIEVCLKSIRPYVEEICVIDTGSTDGTLEIVKKYADKYEVFTECNDEQGIYDFSMARNKSFELASYSTTMWLDADDEILGAENLYKYVDKYKNIDYAYFIQFPYHYSFDATGKCNLVHYRERIFFNDKNFKFVNPVHEVKIMKPGVEKIGCEIGEDIIWKHNRQFVNKVIAPNRNLRILKKWYDQHGDSDARQLYYLGLEYGNAADLDNSKKMLNRYLELSGWDDEKYMALLRLMDYDFYHADYNGAINHALEAIKVKEDWGEAYFMAAKAHYFLANAGTDPDKNWNKCINFAKIGLMLPPTKTLLFVNPNERNIEIHRYLNVAYNKTGRIHEALQSCSSGLEHDPANAELLGNKKIYEDYLRRANIASGIEELCNVGGVSIQNKELIFKLLTEGTAPKGPTEEKDNKQQSAEINWKPYHRPSSYPRNVQEADQPVAVITPHSQAFGIPEKFVYDDLPLKMTDAQLQALVVAVYKEFMLHDEVLSAISFLEKAPHRIRHTDEIETILKHTYKMINWISNEEEYDRGNSTLDYNGELLKTDMTPLTQELNGSAYMRYKWMLDRIPSDKNNEILVLASIDGQESNRLGLLGYKNVVGIDCCSNSVAIANQKAKEFNTGAVHIQSYFDKAPEKLDGKKFDTIIAGDVLEHLIDPVKDLLIPARQMVKETGKMLLTTPWGCWYRGQINNSMHPWKWGDEGNHWLSVKNRGHIIAPTVWSVAKQFRDAGWYIENCTNVPQWFQLVKGQGNVCVKALANQPVKHKNPKKIVFFLGNLFETWTPHTVDCTGIGGSEEMAIHFAKQLAALGHNVSVYNSCGEFEGIFDGVSYLRTEKFHDIECDVLIISRQATAINTSNIKSKINVLWVHDVYPHGFTHEVCDKFDIVFALTEWHKNFMLERFPFLLKDKVIVTRNAIEFERFNKDLPRQQFKAMCSSSPDRSYPALLKYWPKIKEQVPQAELHLFYGFENWERCTSDPGQLTLIKELKDQIASLKDKGVVYHGRVPQHVLAEHFLTSNCFLYPTWFSETFFLGGASCLSGGCRIITSPIAAINETVGEYGIMIEGDWLSKEYEDKFVAAAVKSFKNTDNSDRYKMREIAHKKFNFKDVVAQWDELFENRLNGRYIKAEVPIIPELKLKPYVPILDR